MIDQKTRLDVLAALLAQNGQDQDAARAALEQLVEDDKRLALDAMMAVYGVHPDDIWRVPFTPTSYSARTKTVYRTGSLSPYIIGRPASGAALARRVGLTLRQRRTADDAPGASFFLNDETRAALLAGTLECVSRHVPVPLNTNL